MTNQLSHRGAKEIGSGAVWTARRPGAAVCASSGAVKSVLQTELCNQYARLSLAFRASGLLQRRSELGGRVLHNQGPGWASRSNSALVTDACAAALRAFYGAAQRER